MLATLATTALARCGGVAPSDEDETTEDALDGSSILLEPVGPGEGAEGFAREGAQRTESSLRVPSEVRAELIASGPSSVATPAQWNPNLPKLAGDDSYVYAVHTHYPNEVAARYAVIMRRPRNGGAWVEAARILYPHQPPGIAMDASGRLHLVFDCLRPAGRDVTCFSSNIGTAGLHSRFHHLTFSTRRGDGSLRFDVYAQDTWTGESNGYIGLGLADDGATVLWSFADAHWNRVVRAQSGGSSIRTVATLGGGNAYLNYPIHAGRQPASRHVMYVGEFDPNGGTNAGYFASTLYTGGSSSMRAAFRLTPTGSVPRGRPGSYPSDVAIDDAGRTLVLAYRVDETNNCTELHIFDGGFGRDPRAIDLGCFGTQPKLHVGRNGAIYVLATARRGMMRLGMSSDGGETWTWNEIPVVGARSADVSFNKMAPVKLYTSPQLFNADRITFIFAGVDDAGNARSSYLGTIELGS